jgi:hypothetical protein
MAWTTRRLSDDSVGARKSVLVRQGVGSTKRTRMAEPENSHHATIDELRTPKRTGSWMQYNSNFGDGCRPYGAHLRSSTRQTTPLLGDGAWVRFTA